MATLIKQVQGFTRGQARAGANGLALVEKCIDHMFEHHDWSQLAWLIAKLEARDASVMRAIVGKCVGGISLITKGKEAQKQPSGLHIKMGHNAATTEAMETLRSLIEERVSFRSKRVADELLKRDPAEFDLAKYAKAVMRKLDKEHCTLKDLLTAAADIE